jgi:hypothetical protein
VISSRQLKKGLLVGLPVGIASAISSFSYTGSGPRAILTGALIGALGTFLLGVLEARSEKRRTRLGMPSGDVPVRPKLVMQLGVDLMQAMALFREALERSGLRIKRIEVNEDRRIVALTRLSSRSFFERISIEGNPAGGGACVVEVSSVPGLSFNDSDGGVNYTNVFVLSKFVKERLKSEAIRSETLIDMTLDQGAAPKSS